MPPHIPSAQLDEGAVRGRVRVRAHVRDEGDRRHHEREHHQGDRDAGDSATGGLRLRPLGAGYSGVWQTASTLLPSGSRTNAP
jgi:hypothetical protein